MQYYSVFIYLQTFYKKKMENVYFFYLSAFVFCLGLYLVLTRKNGIVALMGIELMLNGSTINLVAFSRVNALLEGQVFVLFVMVVAAAEVTVGLALLLNVYRHYQSIDLEDINELKG